MCSGSYKTAEATESKTFRNWYQSEHQNKNPINHNHCVVTATQRSLHPWVKRSTTQAMERGPELASEN